MELTLSVDTDGRLRISGACTVATVPDGTGVARRLLQESDRRHITVDLSRLTHLDTVGAVWLRRLPAIAAEAGKDLELGEAPAAFGNFTETLSADPEEPAPSDPDPVINAGLLDRLGEKAYAHVSASLSFLYLASDLTWAAVSALADRRGIRRGTFVEQATRVGADGLSIVAVILFLIGGVSTLQAAAQLRQFGANVLVADLLAIGITRELGPLMTAIMVAGRSGSAFAAEIATMKFTEEIDALRTMGLNPLRLVAVPKMWAMLLTVPLLTIMANFIGLAGGTGTGVLSLDISPATFISRVQNALLLKDILTGLVKSVSFAWVITVVSVFHGLRFRGGAAGVGEATTSSVVSSIFAIIVLDLVWNLLFYLR
ncbi:MAG TPA: ABC transporter permease [Candidatus Latescibacteria bacterium]|nr:ABC transporter permease [Candidatus Latescibacterota bacterium]HJP34271.1 ABC transporter permease [Candidatus Latescibacterota bacterium]